MTADQKRLWNMLPPGEWVSRDETSKRYGVNGFQLALSALFKKTLIELEFVEDGQIMRRKTIEEITLIPPRVLHKL